MIRCDIDPDCSRAYNIHSMLEAAESAGVLARFAWNLVAAALENCLPSVPKVSRFYDDRRQPRASFGTVQVNDTVIFAVAEPTFVHYGACQETLDAGRKAYLLVPEELVSGIWQNAAWLTGGPAVVDSLESFIGTMLDRLGGFEAQASLLQLAALIALFNKRVMESPTDKALVIDCPEPLSYPLLPATR